MIPLAACLLRDRLPEMVALITERIPEVREWESGRLEQWLTWYAQRDMLGVVQRAGHVVGVGTARPVRPGQEAETYAMDWQGDTVWIDLAVATDRSATRDLWHLLTHRFGTRNYIGYNRAKHGDRVRRQPFAPFLARFFRQ